MRHARGVARSTLPSARPSAREAAAAPRPPASPAGCGGTTRRSVLVGGAATCAVLGLAACSSSSDVSSSTGDGRPSVTPGGLVSAGLAAGETLPFETPDGEPGVLVRLEDKSYVAYSAVCTHQGCAVQGADGPLLECPCHGSVFDPADDGAPLEGPAGAPLARIEVRETDEGVVLA